MATMTNTLRLPPETKKKLQQMARERAARERREVRWTTLVKDAIQKMLSDYDGQSADVPPVSETVPS